MKTIRIGAGAGYSGDRIEPAVELAEKGALDYLVFECLAERTIALAQQAKLKDPRGGFDPLLEARFRAVLPICRANGVHVITNMGAANPVGGGGEGAGDRALARPEGLKIAAVTGDDVLASARRDDLALDIGGTLNSLGNRVISANAYTGAAPIAAALAAGRRCRDHRPRRRPGDVPRRLRARVRLGDGRLGRARRAAPWSAICSNAPAR